MSSQYYFIFSRCTGSASKASTKSLIPLTRNDEEKEYTIYNFRYQMHASFDMHLEKKKASKLLAFFFSTYCQNLITRQRMNEDQVEGNLRPAR